MTDITNVVVKANRLFTGGPVCVCNVHEYIYVIVCVCALLALHNQFNLSTGTPYGVLSSTSVHTDISSPSR